MLKGHLFKVRYDCLGNEGDLIYATTEFESAWTYASKLSPVNPVVWKLAVVHAQVLKITAVEEAIELLKTTINAARGSEGLDENDPDFKLMVQMYQRMKKQGL